MSGTTRSRIRHEKTCKHCKNVFDVPNYRKNTALFCSRRCMALDARQEITANCAECNTKFTHISSRVNKAKYCSQLCFHRAMSKKGSVEYKCQHCDKIFLDAPSHKRKYCSKECVNKAHISEWKPHFSTARKSMLRRNMLIKCELCGFDAHPEILGVHHKDHNHKNNCMNNLQVLCPNCHSLQHSKHIPH